MVLAAACAGDAAFHPTTEPPTLTGLKAATNPYNALSIALSFRVAGADSARILYRTASDPEAATPFYRVHDGQVRLVALGLRPSSSYSLEVEALGAGGLSRAGTIATTDPLPALLRSVHLRVSGTPSPGYLLVTPEFFGGASDGFILIFDEAGLLRWYRKFDGEGWAVEAKQQRNGDFTVYLGRSFGYQPTAGRYAEVRPTGEDIRSFRVNAPGYTDPHEMLFSFADSGLAAVHLLGYEVRAMDLTSIGGSAVAPVALHFIERQGATGVTQFTWNAGDHYSIADAPVPNPGQPDLVHPSSLALTRDGNYLISLQALDEVAEIDGRTGAYIWRFGGRHNEFTMVNDPGGGFQGQHHVQLLADGHLLLLDDRPRASPAGTRAVEYALDVPTRTARLVWEYRPDPAVLSPIMGSVQRLANGNTVVGFAMAARVDEVGPSGAVIGQSAVLGDAGVPIQFYRALRIGSLYGYEEP
jgi:hypothetical protein